MRGWRLRPWFSVVLGSKFITAGRDGGDWAGNLGRCRKVRGWRGWRGAMEEVAEVCVCIGRITVAASDSNSNGHEDAELVNVDVTGDMVGKLIRVSMHIRRPHGGSQRR